MRILITGGAGFIGSNLAVYLKKYLAGSEVFCADSLKRTGTDLILRRLRSEEIAFYHADIRCPEDLDALPAFDLLIDCSAEPSVHQGVQPSANLYTFNTNLVGTFHCLELARKNRAGFLFLSTSRVYPIELINSLNYEETESRFELSSTQSVQGVSENGISEMFPLMGRRSLYGATKLSGELLLQEYAHTYQMPALINRCGVVAGPWQLGRMDQGIVSYWILQQVFQRDLKFIGFGGQGKQVRDFLHIDDLSRLVLSQIQSISSWNCEVFNVGGGKDNALSIYELDNQCQQITKTCTSPDHDVRTSINDIKFYVTDNKKVCQDFSWRPMRSCYDILMECYSWVERNRRFLEEITRS